MKEKIDKTRVDEMVQGVRMLVLAADSNNLSLILKTYKVEGENQIPQVDL